MKRTSHKGKPDFREPSDGVKRQKVFCDITWEHPAEIYKLKIVAYIVYKVSRDVVFTLQKKLFEHDSNEWLQLVIIAVIQSGTTEEYSAFVIRKDSEGVFLYIFYMLEC